MKFDKTKPYEEVHGLAEHGIKYIQGGRLYTARGDQLEEYTDPVIGELLPHVKRLLEGAEALNDGRAYMLALELEKRLMTNGQRFRKVFSGFPGQRKPFWHIDEAEARKQAQQE